MSKKIIILIIFVIAIAAIFLLSNEISFSPVSDSPSDKIIINPEIPDITLPFSNNPKDLAWAVFQQYLKYNKNLDFEGVKKVVYKTASVCNNPQTRVDCESRMNLAYLYGDAMKKEDFVNVWSDENQIILATNFRTEEDDQIIVRNRSIIYFLKDGEDIKMISFSPFKGITTAKSSASEEELDYRITRYIEDKDEDGIADYEEECLHLLVEERINCIQTDPKLRDTDGNGLWDGIEAEMNREF